MKRHSSDLAHQRGLHCLHSLMPFDESTSSHLLRRWTPAGAPNEDGTPSGAALRLLRPLRLARPRHGPYYSLRSPPDVGRTISSLLVTTAAAVTPCQGLSTEHMTARDARVCQVPLGLPKVYLPGPPGSDAADGQLPSVPSAAHRAATGAIRRGNACRRLPRGLPTCSQKLIDYGEGLPSPPYSPWHRASGGGAPRSHLAPTVGTCDLDE